MVEPRQLLRGLIQVSLLLLTVLAVGGGLFFIYQSTLAGAKANLTLPSVNLTTCSSSGSSPDPQEMFYAMQLQQRQGELGLTAGNDATEVIYSVKPGQSATEIAGDLEAKGFVRDADLFLTLLRCRKLAEKIQAGDHVLRRNMTMDQVAVSLQRSFQRGLTISIRPGWRAEEIADYLATVGFLKFDKDRFLQLVKSGGFDFPSLRDRPRNAPPAVEGFLLPETYNVLVDTPEDQVISRLLSTFDQRMTEKMKQQAAAQKLTLYEVVTVASIVEREAVLASERPIIASVYLNRVRRKMTLNADPTVQYAMGYQAATKQWWKTPVTLEEYAKVDSPYNTYLYAGLPPGPICEPSTASLQAVLEPAQTDYLYFVAKGDGGHVFARTLEEQNVNMQKYGYTVPVVPTKKP